MDHRLRMLELATAELPFIQIDTTEIQAQMPMYTVDTLIKLKQTHDQITWIIGADSWHHWDHWHQASRILTLCNLLVLTRPGFSIEGLERLNPKTYHDQPDSGYVSFLEVNASSNESHASSSQIRQNTQQFSAWLHKDVLQYLSTHQLYKEH